MYRMVFAAAVLSALAAPAFAQSYHGGQYPAPPSLAAQSALPSCGFAAIESWGSNGFQYCDPGNIQGSYRHRFGRSGRTSGAGGVAEARGEIR
jgi:hypothetical protein